MRKPKQTKMESPTPPGEINLAPLKFLIIEDSKTFRFAIRKLIFQLGGRMIDEAIDGDTGMQAISRENYDVILCDYNLGDGKDGQQILEELRYHSIIDQRASFLMITGETSMGMVLSALESHPDGYLTKPISSERLLSCLIECTQHKQMVKTIYQAIAEQKYQIAKQLCRETMVKNPSKTFDLLKINGEICLDAEDYNEAKTIFEQVLKRKKLPWARLGVGKAYFFLRNYDAATDVLNSLISEQGVRASEAYEWLAKTEIAQGKLEKAQTTLETLTKLTPKLILRQKMLGEVATTNQDYKIAMQAYNAAIRFGKNSCHKSSEEYLELAQIFITIGDVESADRIIVDAEWTFAELDKNNDDTLKFMVAHALIGMRRNKEATAKPLNQALSFYQKNNSDIGLSPAFYLLRGLFQAGDQASAMQLLKQLISNYRGSKRLSTLVSELVANNFISQNDADLPTEKDMVAMNNNGIRLFKDKQYDQAIAFFNEAANFFPGSVSINLNAAHIIISQAKTSRVPRESIVQAKKYIERAGREGVSSKKHRELLESYNQLLD